MLTAALVLGATCAACSGQPAGADKVPDINAGSVPFGVFVGSGSPGGVARFAARTGTKPSLASDYLPQTDGWADMVDVTPLRKLLGPWHSGPYRLVLGVPMIPTRDGRAVGTLAEGATGSYDRNFATLAKNLVSIGYGDAVLRLGWEFNGPWYPWAVTSSADAVNFAAFFRNVVTSMRAVAGSAFAFVWNTTAGPEPEAPQNAYPGDAYVDYVGMDLYDEVWGIPLDPALAWARYVTEPNGLQWLASFAALHRKLIVIPEWGLIVRSAGHGLGDDPLFVANMAQWTSTHDVAFTSYFDVDASDILDGAFPLSWTVFKRSFATPQPVALLTASG